MAVNGNTGHARVGGPSPNIATSNHGPCGGCGQPVVQREYSGDGVVKLFDEVTQDYAPWHPECARLARGAQVGSLLPNPAAQALAGHDDEWTAAGRALTEAAHRQLDALGHNTQPRASRTP